MAAPRFPWYNSIRFRVGLALFVLFALQAATTGFTLYEVNLRKHDYEILNLAGQMRVLSSTLLQQSRNYLGESVRHIKDNPQTPGLYYRDLQQQTQLYDKIITSFRKRQLDPEITGRAEPLVCKWDHRSRTQLDISSDEWDNFKFGLGHALGPKKTTPALLAAAHYIDEHGEKVVSSTEELSRAFQFMMEGKLALIRMSNMMGLVIAALLSLFIAVLVYRKVLRPLTVTVAGFVRVANGDLGYQVPVAAENEIGSMSLAFNSLSERIYRVFRLTDRIGQGTNLHDALKFICEEFRTLLPVEWVCVLVLTPDRTKVALERLYSENPSALRENDSFDFAMGLPEAALAKGKALAIDDLAAVGRDKGDTFLAAKLAQDGKKSALMVPLSHKSSSEAVLVFASSEPAAYTPEHVEFLTNLAAQISHILDKTIFMEGLVVAAVEGLAKLAESRDPETGGHLVRMSLYSAILANELGKDNMHRDQITPAYERDLFRFAPMHDIGKVGISDDILLKPGRLDPDERTAMELHPTIGGQVLRRSEEQVKTLGHSIFGIGIEIAECHHEKFDGSGYPNKLIGEAIPLSARIIALADVFDALTSRRPYKEAWPIEKALEVINNDVGRHFDPLVVAAFNQAMPRLRVVYQQYKHC